jgi:regulatory protein
MDRRTPKRLEKAALWNYALRVLGGRAHSVSELRDKLSRRAERQADVDDALSRLKEYGYLDDKRLAESYAASRRDNEGHGRLRVLRDLRQKRVAPTVAERAVGAAYAEVEEDRLIEAFLKRKYRNIVLKEYLADRSHLASAYRRLRLAGFGSSNAIQVLKRYADEAEALDSLEPPEGEG